MIGILRTAGYSPSSATNRINTSHPLLELTPPDWYRSSAPRYDAIDEE